MTAELVISTIINLKPQGIHSDMEGQYISDQFEMMLKRFKNNHSYSLNSIRYPYLSRDKNIHMVNITFLNRRHEDVFKVTRRQMISLNFLESYL